MSEEILRKHHYVNNNGHGRQKKIWAIIIFFLGAFVFFLCTNGYTEGLSNAISTFLKTHLGFTNKWSSTFGPRWYVQMNDDVAALGGGVVLIIFYLILNGYFLIRKKQREIAKFAFIIIGGGFILLIFKLIYAVDIPDNPINYNVTNPIPSFPSGHAAMGAIFYLSIATYISRRQHKSKVRRYTIICAIVLIVLIGVSRFLNGTHTITEVIAGWSLGFSWLSLCWLLEIFLKKRLPADLN